MSWTANSLGLLAPSPPAPSAQDVAVLIRSDDPAFGRNRVDDPYAVLVEQRVELLTECAEVANLHLDQLAVRTDQVDHEPSHRHLDAVARLRQQRLHGSVERPLTHHPDRRHGRRG
jgi:hypothetical protein